MGKAYDPKEAERLLAEHGLASGGSASRALATLLHGQHQAWAVVSVGDNLHRHIDRPITNRPPVEIGPRTRTITIELLERGVSPVDIRPTIDPPEPPPPCNSEPSP